jgi:putative Holliday junction resolvase
MPDTPEKNARTILAFDFGHRRIGVAVGQRITGSATPLTVVRVTVDGPDWTAIERLIGEWQPDRLIVGLPFHADGSDAEIGDAARAFARELDRFAVPTELVDERFSSTEAESVFRAQRQAGLRRRVQKGDIDAIAAAIIAERWLAIRSTDDS